MESKKEKVVIDEEVKVNHEEAETNTDEREIKIQKLEKTIVDLTNEVETIKRAAADIVNRNKQMESDKKYASADVVKKLLVPLSYFEGALKYQTNDEGLKNFLKGFEMIYNLILNQLYSEGLKEIETKIGEPFNPYLHEVTEVVESEQADNDKIIEIVQKGFYFKDRVIQPVKIKISKQKEIEIETNEKEIK